MTSDNKPLLIHDPDLLAMLTEPIKSLVTLKNCANCRFWSNSLLNYRPTGEQIHQCVFVCDKKWVYMKYEEKYELQTAPDFYCNEWAELKQT